MPNPYNVAIQFAAARPLAVQDRDPFQSNPISSIYSHRSKPPMGHSDNLWTSITRDVAETVTSK
jgi:hypothetical protein